MSRRMEIVVAESSYGRSRNPSRPLSRARTVGYVAEPFDSEKLPATLISDIRQFLRVANEIENESPRVAYLCRFHAFEKAHTLDPNSSGRGVRQFKIALLQWLERDGEATILMRKEMSDTRELKQLYLKYKDYIRRQNIQDPADREKVVTAHVIASVLFEVLKTFTSEAAQEILAAGDDIYVPYNILPLDPSGAQQAIMQLPEIKAAVAAVQNIRGLPLSENHHKSGNVLDLLDWLQHWFGFQKGNVANQREHLILLLANMHIRQTPKPESISKLDERAVDQLMKKLFKNYMNWCKFLGRKSNVWLPTVHQEVQQHKILYMSLYLLIWGEASNLRLMPECLCYIYHNMSYELYGVLSRADSLVTGEKVVPVYGGESESFLNNVVTPIYKVIYEEAQKNKGGTVDHSNWRNYDDLNEYFWSPDCFQLGWPMRLDSSFFHTFSSSDDCHTVNKLDRERFPKLSYQDAAQRVTCLIDEKMKAIKDAGLKWLDKKKFVDIHSIWHLFVSAVQTKESEGEGEKWLGKTNFVEIRSFWHLFRSFDRMWTCFILALQVMIILSWHGLRSPIELFDAAVLEDIMTIFITSAVLNFMQAILDIVITWKARQAMNLFQTLRYVLKVVVAAMWAIILPVNYARSGNNSYCSGEPYRSWVGEWMCFSPYIITLAIYLVTNAIGMVLFFVPALSSYIETSNWRVLTILSWWSQPRLYVGRGMQESQISLFKYTIFWVILLISKFSFSYYFEIKPLVEPTKQIMQIGVNNYEWHELFPRVKRNAGAVLAIWAPVILVYFMDTQIWYAIFCMIFGGVCGLFHRLGEIRTMGMLRTRFQSLPAAFNVHLFPSPPNERKRNMASFFGQKFCKVSENEIDVIMRFAEVWNQIISSFRLEDLISNREMDLMIVPSSSKLASAPVHWPVFLLATKFSTALNMAKDFDGTDQDLYRKIRKDNYMYCAVKECYESLKYILDFLVIGDLDKRVVSGIINEVETSINRSTLLVDFKMSKLPALYDKFIQLVNLLVENEQYSRDKIAILIQDMFEVVTKDMMVHRSSILDSIYCSEQLEEDTSFLFGQPEVQTFASKSAIYFPLPDTSFLKEQIKRLLLLLTAKESAMDIPMNLEARRRISFFATSLFMDMPNAPKVRNMLAFSVMTPYYTEEVNFSKEELHSEQELDGVSIIFYMQTIYPDEWKNFLERMECENEEEFNISGKMEELRDWASSRGQTLSRTVRGMMYYRKALKLQAFLDMANNHEILKGYDAIVRECDTNTSQRSLLAHIEALADMKFTYVISCQTFGPQKSSEDPRARDILDLMIKHPSLRVAYIEEKEEIETNKPQKVYYSVLVKAVNKFDQEIYRIKLPGPPIIGEGKPENQNHAIIFTRGEALQTIDMNQDNYMEEALKMRNILQEFLKHQGERRPTVLGLREHIFTGSISSLAGFMSYQETSFVTIGQRVLADPLRVRFHYGHPDLFDRVFHITRGGISKASKTINLSEDVFAGFNSTLRRGNVTYQEYMQVGKGRDVGFNQISKFEAKVANGNSEQTLSRDIYRLGHRFDFFRMLSCYFTTVGFYFNILITVIGAYIFLYGQLYLVLSGMEKAILVKAGTRNIESLETALASQSFIQLGLLTGLPMLMEIGLEKGFRAALSEFVVMQLQLASVFFTFSLGTKSHYYGRTLLHGGAKYRPSGRKFVVFFHASFTENYRLYSRSHFVKGFELMLLLIVYNLFRQSYLNSMTYMIVTYSIWFMAGTWLFAPFLFNPLGFLWPKVVDDWTEWNRWIKNRVGIGVHQDKSWEAWWNEEQVHLKNSGWGARIFEILLSLRFFVYQYGLVYHLDISQANKNISVYLLSWLVIATIFLVVKVVKHGQQWLSTEFQLLFRLFKVLLFLGSLSIIIALSITCKLSIMDLFICFLAFLPTGWGLLLIAQAVRPLIKDWGIWDSVQVLTQAYDYGMGLLLFVPVAALAWLPFISSFHNRFLFNQAFSRRLQIKKILLARNKRK